MCFDISNNQILMTDGLIRCLRGDIGDGTLQDAMTVLPGAAIPEEHETRLTFYQFAHHRHKSWKRRRGIGNPKG